MRVALLIDSLTGGGSEGVVRRLAAGLVARGHEVFVHCLKTVGSIAPPPDVALIEHASRGWDLLLPLRLANRFRRDGIEIVHAHSCAALCVAWPAAKLCRIPLVHVRHGWPVVGPDRYARWAERLSPTVDRVVINCESARGRLTHPRVKSGAVHIPNGVECECVAPAEARGRIEALCGTHLPGPVILSVANIRPEKDQLNLLRAFANLRESRPTAALICVGAASDAVYAARVTAEIERLGLRGSVHLVGAVEGAASLMRGADDLCVSSVNDAMPNVVLEAMAQRVPIVATGVGDIGRVDARESDSRFMLRAGETALLVAPGDSAALAKALDAALADQAAASARADAAFRDHAARFSTQRMVQRYEALYEQILSRSRRTSSRTTRTSRRGAARSTSPASRPTVLMIGPAAPQIGGMVTAIETLMSAPLREQYELVRFATVAPGGALNARRPWRIFTALFQHFAAIWRLMCVILRNRVQLVHIHTCSFISWHRSVIDALVARLLGCRVIFHVRGGRFVDFCRTAGPLASAVIRRGAQLAEEVVVLSDNTASALRELLPGVRFEVVPNGVPVEHTLTAAAPTPNCRFLFLGAPTESKGIFDLLDAAEILHRGATPFRLLIVGPAEPAIRSRLAREIAARRLDTVVGIREAVTAKDRGTLLSSVDCLVHPSHSEAMPNTLLEAGAAGLAVIASDVGSVGEMVRASVLPRPDVPVQARDALLVAARDPRGLAMAMERVAREPKLRRQLGESFRQRVAAEFDRDVLSRRLQAIYGRVLPKAGRSAEVCA